MNLVRRSVHFFGASSMPFVGQILGLLEALFATEANANLVLEMLCLDLRTVGPNQQME